MLPLAATHHQQSTRHISLSRSVAAAGAHSAAAAAAGATKMLNNGTLGETSDHYDTAEATAQLKPLSSSLRLSAVQKNSIARDELVNKASDYDTENRDFSDGDIFHSTAGAAADEKCDNNTSSTVTEQIPQSAVIIEHSASRLRSGNGLSYPSSQRPVEILLDSRRSASESPSPVDSPAPLSTSSMLRFVPTAASRSGNKFKQIPLNDFTSNTQSSVQAMSAIGRVAIGKQMDDLPFAQELPRFRESNEHGSHARRPQQLRASIDDDRDDDIYTGMPIDTGLNGDIDNPYDSYVDSETDLMQQLAVMLGNVDEEPNEHNDLNAGIFAQSVDADDRLMLANWRKVPDDYVAVSVPFPSFPCVPCTRRNVCA